MTNRVRRQLSAACAAAGLAVGLPACAPDPIAWRDDARRERLPIPTPERPIAAPEVGADSVLRTALVARLGCAGKPCATAFLPAPLPAHPTDSLGQPCPTSLRWAAGKGGERVAVWWSVRGDRSAALRAARSTDGGATWGPAVPVDTLDRSEAACGRPAPSVAVDAVNGYVHVAYSLAAPEGKGIFYAHQMDPRAAFEIPQAIVYGERPAETSVASDGDRVVLAYEDPNTGGRPFVSLALSRTGGHTWEERVPATEGNSAAERPLVTVRDRAVVLGWIERSAPSSLGTLESARSATLPYPSAIVVRSGTLRR